MTDIKYRISDNLINIERGPNELLLANSYNLSPMYIKKGKDYIISLISYLQQTPRTKENILKDYPNDEGLIDYLIGHNILISGEEQKATDIDISKPGTNGNKTNGMSAYFLLTQSCNFSCIYCLNGCKTYKKNENLLMPKAVAFKALDTFAAMLTDDGRLEVVLFGGEPLLNWRLAKDMILYCENTIKQKHPLLNIHYHATTNLGRLPVDFVKWSREYKISVLCDVDGTEETHNLHRPFKNGAPSFEIVSRHIKKLVKAGIPVSLRTTVTGMNERDTCKTTSLHKEMLGQSSAFVPVNLTNSDGDILPDEMIPSLNQLCDSAQELYDCKVWELSNLFPFSTYSGNIAPGHRSVVGCGAPYGNTPVVDVNGNIYPCIYLVGIPDYDMGNITEGTYPQTEKLQALADELHVDKRDDCKSCNWRYLCGGGCPVQKLIIKGREKELTPKARTYCEKINCEYTKKVLTILLWDAAQKAEERYKSAAAPVETPTRRNARVC